MRLTCGDELVIEDPTEAQIAEAISRVACGSEPLSCLERDDGGGSLLAKGRGRGLGLEYREGAGSGGLRSVDGGLPEDVVISVFIEYARDPEGAWMNRFTWERAPERGGEEVPLHRWVVIECQSEQRVLAFTYRDASAGLSAKGVVLEGASPGAEDARSAAERPFVTVRLPGFPVRPLTAGELEALTLPSEPSWLRFFLPEEAADRPWRSDPDLVGRLHSQFPDDVQAMMFFPEVSVVESLWVRLKATAPEIGGYSGTLLNTPSSPSPYAAGLRVVLRVAPGVGSPVILTPVMFQNLLAWEGACEGCGFDLLVEPAEALWGRQFPGSPPGAEPVAFTTRCPLCKASMVVRRKDVELN